jgi:hypothetical protein
MTAGPEPDINGNLTVAAECCGCSDETMQAEPLEDLDYGQPSLDPVEPANSVRTDANRPTMITGG